MRTLILLSGLLLAFGLYAQDPDAQPVTEDSELYGPEIGNPLQPLFLTGQFGGGVMTSFGGGFGFFENIVRTEGLVGYTAAETSSYQGISIQAKLNARLIRIEAHPKFVIYQSFGTGFTFFPNAGQIVSSAYLAQEFDLYRLIGSTVVTLYVEEDFYFVPTKEGNFLFQLAIGLRFQPFLGDE